MMKILPVLIFLGLSLQVHGQHAGGSEALRHVVLIKFKESAAQQDVDRVITAFAALKDEIAEIKAFEWGENNSPEGLNQGLTHCFLITFGSEAARDVYLVHEAHERFVEVLLPHLDKVTVVDYWAR